MNTTLEKIWLEQKILEHYGEKKLFCCDYTTQHQEQKTTVFVKTTISSEPFELIFSLDMGHALIYRFVSVSEFPIL